MSLEVPAGIAGQSPQSTAHQRPVTVWLAGQPKAILTFWAIAAAFTAYACMYAFRRPYTVATFSGLDAWGLDFKAIAVVAQILGYTVSKFLGIKFVTESRPGYRIPFIVVLILVAEAALLLFAVVPAPWKIACLFLNGLPLGMVWGLVFSFLEGRRVTDFMCLGLSVSVIFASGWVKSVGAWTMYAWGVDETWMPVLTGAIFIAPLGLALWMMAQLPPPDATDIAARTVRVPMDKAARHAFLRVHWLGVFLLVGGYLALMTYRDLRDTFMVDILADRGTALSPGGFAIIESTVGVAVIAALFVLCFILWFFRSNRVASGVIAASIGLGAILTAAATALHTAGALSPRAWVIVTGIGLYLGFVPLQSFFLDRLLAVVRQPATAIFLVAIADSFGYLSTVSLYTVLTFTAAQFPWADVLVVGSYVLGAVVPLLVGAGTIHFLRSRRAADAVQNPHPEPERPSCGSRSPVVPNLNISRRKV